MSQNFVPVASISPGYPCHLLADACPSLDGSMNWFSHLKQPSVKVLELSWLILSHQAIKQAPKWVWSQPLLSFPILEWPHPSTVLITANICPSHRPPKSDHCSNHILTSGQLRQSSPPLTCPLAVAHLGKGQALLDRWRAAPDWVPAASQAAPRLSRQPPSLPLSLSLLHTQPNSTFKVTTCAELYNALSSLYEQIPRTLVLTVSSATCLHFHSLPNDHRWLTNRDNRLSGRKTWVKQPAVSAQNVCTELPHPLLLTCRAACWNRMGIGRAELKQSRSRDSALSPKPQPALVALALVPGKIYETLSRAQDGARLLLWRIHHTFFFSMELWSGSAKENWKDFKTLIWQLGSGDIWGMRYVTISCTMYMLDYRHWRRFWLQKLFGERRVGCHLLLGSWGNI